jgi:hypothetical protein
MHTAPAAGIAAQVRRALLHRAAYAIVAAFRARIVCTVADGGKKLRVRVAAMNADCCHRLFTIEGHL